MEGYEVVLAKLGCFFLKVFLCILSVLNLIRSFVLKLLTINSTELYQIIPNEKLYYLAPNCHHLEIDLLLTLQLNTHSNMTDNIDMLSRVQKPSKDSYLPNVCHFLHIRLFSA